MRKLFCIILAFLFIFPNGWVYADDATATQEVEIIKFEAEDFISATYKANSILNNDASNGEFLQIYKNPDNNDIIFEYSVDVSKDGLYEIRGVTSVWGSHLTADFLISVNDSEFKAPRVTKLADVTNSAAPSIMTKNSLGVYNFVRGSNVIKVKVDQNDKRSDGLIISYLDSFEVLPGKEELNGGLMSIDTTPGIGVFEKQESVKLVLNFSGPIGSDLSYRFIITDAWNNEVKTGVVTARKKQEKYTVNIGNFDLGWYKVKLYENDEQMTDTGLQTLFSVIQNTNKRKFYSDSPFATDFASRYHFNGTNQWQPNDVGAVAEYAEVMHDIGISWARNRTHDILPATPESVKTKTEDPHGDAILSNDVSILECCYGNGSEFVYDLRDVYNSHKYYAEIHKGKSKTLEINNEEDAHSSSPGDVFASFFKAAALGIADGDPNMKKEIGGLCMDTSNPFTRILYMNDFMKYSDYATGHAHKQSGTELTTINGNAILKDFINISNAYDSKKGLEMNEGGLGYVCDVGAYASDGAMLTQARYYIVQQTTYLSWESDRNYWFLFEYYPEFGVNYGSFSPYNEPYPVINSIATTTYNLGKGKFKGVLDNLPAGAQGYMFDDGENDVAVIWYNDQQDASGNWEIRTDKAVTVVDMMGKESVKKAIGNKALIPVSYWPTFVKFNGRTDKYNYYLTEKAERVTDVVEYDKNDRVLIQTLWDGQDLQEAKQNGYVLKLDEEQPIKVNVYNFNKEAVSGTIKVSSDNEDMVEIRNAEINYELEPGGKSEYVVYAKLKDEKYSGLQAYYSARHNFTENHCNIF